MTPGQVTTLVVVMMILIGGPLYLVGQAMERRAARKAKAWSTSPAGIQQHATVARMRIDSLGPLSQREHDALLYNILFVTSFEGSVTWEGIIAQTAGARQAARHYPNGLPWLADADTVMPAGQPTEPKNPEDPVEGDESDVTEGKRDTPTGRRH